MRNIFLLLAAMGVMTLSAQTDLKTTSGVTGADSITSGTKVAEKPSIPTLDPGTLHRKPKESETVAEPCSITVIAPSANYEEASYDATPHPLQQILSDQRGATPAVYDLLGCRVANGRFRIVNGRLVYYK